MNPVHALLVWKHNVTPATVAAVQQFSVVLSGFAWVKVAESVYVVRMVDSGAYAGLVASLNAIAAGFPRDIRYIMSPPLIGGEYAGFLDAEVWASIARTKTVLLS